jgi:hypothetical protein
VPSTGAPQAAAVVKRERTVSLNVSKGAPVHLRHLLVSLLFVTSMATASDWVPIGVLSGDGTDECADSLVLVDASTVKRQESRVAIWFKFQRHSHCTIKYEHMFAMLDCENTARTKMQHTEYYESSTKDIKLSGNVEYFSPDDRRRFYFAAVCGEIVRDEAARQRWDCKERFLTQRYEEMRIQSTTAIRDWKECVRYQDTARIEGERCYSGCRRREDAWCREQHRVPLVDEEGARIETPTPRQVFRFQVRVTARKRMEDAAGACP